MKKTIISILTILAIYLSTNLIAKASIVESGCFTYFFKQYVDSNEYTYICSSTSSGWLDGVQISLGAIYKANGSESNYKKVYVMPHTNGTTLESRLLNVNTSTYYSVPAAYQGNNVSSQLFAMGHNPSLDCQITGIFSSD